jgi:hypothetical protein
VGYRPRLRVRSLTGTERDAFDISLLENRGKSREVNLRNMRAKLDAASVRKADDSHVFTDGQVDPGEEERRRAPAGVPGGPAPERCGRGRGR